MANQQYSNPYVIKEEQELQPIKSSSSSSTGAAIIDTHSNNNNNNNNNNGNNLYNQDLYQNPAEFAGYQYEIGGGGGGGINSGGGGSNNVSLSEEEFVLRARRRARYKVDLSSTFRQSWDIYKANCLIIFLLCLLVIGVALVTLVIMAAILNADTGSSKNNKSMVITSKNAIVEGNLTWDGDWTIARDKMALIGKDRCDGSSTSVGYPGCFEFDHSGDFIQNSFSLCNCTIITNVSITVAVTQHNDGGSNNLNVAINDIFVGQIDLSNLPKYKSESETYIGTVTLNVDDSIVEIGPGQQIVKIFDSGCCSTDHKDPIHVYLRYINISTPDSFCPTSSSCANDNYTTCTPIDSSDADTSSCYLYDNLNYAKDGGNGGGGGDDEHKDDKASGAQVFGAVFIFMLSLFFVLAPMSRGLTIAALKCLIFPSPNNVHPYAIPFSDYFLGYSFLTIIITVTCITFLLGFIPYAGPIILVPYASLSMMFAIPMSYCHPSMPTSLAIGTAAKVVNNNLCNWLGFALFIIFINIVGALMFGIGLFITIPMTLISVAVVYKNILIDTLDDQ